MKNLKLVVIMFNTMEHCSKDYRNEDVNSTSLIHYQHQWELEQKKSYDIEAPKVDRNNWVKTMENIVTYLKLVKGMRGTQLTYVVLCNVKVAHISPGSKAYLNLHKDANSNLMMSQDTLDRVYLNHQADTFKINNAMMYQIL